ncbi:class I adenylate-forming enzyme family protein [Nocardiopsis coralliicola]
MDQMCAMMAADPDRTVFRDPRDVYTGGQTADAVYRVGRELAERGAGLGSRVALLGPASGRMYIASRAVELLGAAQLEIPLTAAAEEQAALAARCGATHAVVDPGHTGPEALAALSGIPGCRVAALAPCAAADDLFAAADSRSAEPLAHRARAGEPHRISFTSGSTGPAKAVLRRWRPGLGKGGAHFLRVFGAERGTVRVVVAGTLTSLQRTLCDAAIASGGSCIALADYAPAPLADAVAAHRATHLMIPTHALRTLLGAPGAAEADFSSLRGIFTGAAMVGPALLRRAVERFGPIVHVTYGQTEAGGICWLSPADYAVSASAGPPRVDPVAAGTCGQPVPGADVEIRDTAGLPCPPGVPGRVWVRTSILMDGYLDQPEASAAKMRGGKLDTGDVGYLDGDGRLILLGRARDAMEVGGAAVFPAETDTVLQGHPSVADAATFDVPGPGGTLLHTAVVPRGAQPDPSSLHAFAERRLPADRRPASYLFVSHIPQTFAHEPCRTTLRTWHRAAAG